MLLQRGLHVLDVELLHQAAEVGLQHPVAAMGSLACSIQCSNAPFLAAAAADDVACHLRALKRLALDSWTQLLICAAKGGHKRLTR